jgi:hypothetical protein
LPFAGIPEDCRSIKLTAVYRKRIVQDPDSPRLDVSFHRLGVDRGIYGAKRQCFAA